MPYSRFLVFYTPQGGTEKSTPQGGIELNDRKSIAGTNPGERVESQDKCLGGIFKSLMLIILLRFLVFYDRKSRVTH